MISETLMRSFLTLARTKNVTEAARQLYLSQQAVSKHLARLEEDLDCILFRRERGGMVLTDEGEIYYEAFSHMEDTLTAAREKADRLRTDAASRLVVGQLDLLNVYRLFKPLYREFSAANPDVRLIYRSTSDWATARQLQEGRVDVVFLFLEGLPESNEFDYLVMEELREVLVVAADHPLAATAKSYQDFKDDPVFYTPEPGDGRGREDRMERLGITADRLVESDGILSSCSAVEMGQGVTFMTEYCRLLDSENFLTFPTDQPATLVMAWLRGSKKPALRRFVDFVAGRAKSGGTENGTL